SRAGSLLFWKTSPDPAASAPHEPLALAAAFALLAGLAALTLCAGPVSGWLAVTADTLYDPAATIAANRLGGGS
ncbi:MAG: monovalent cation/H+ antiporter subunit D, partial [Tabrizicola sp.]